MVPLSLALDIPEMHENLLVAIPRLRMRMRSYLNQIYNIICTVKPYDYWESAIPSSVWGYVHLF